MVEKVRMTNELATGKLPAVVPAQPSSDSTELYRHLDLDRRLHGVMARMTGGVSPYAIMRVWADWAVHTARAPGRQIDLWEKAISNIEAVSRFAAKEMRGDDPETPFLPKRTDPRFDHPAWKALPFSVMEQSFLAAQDWWDHAACGLEGVTRQDSERVAFMARQTLDLWSPSNFPWLNPEILETTLREGGRNLGHGAAHFVEDYLRTITQSRKPEPENLRVGHELACTPGKVIFRNEIMELIQYSPQSEKVQAEPVLIIPAWIMKYYILDLSPENSFIRYLVSQGFTVFAISWCNPTAEQAELGLEDYRIQGIMAALDVIGKVCPEQKVHANGYCLGGTLLAVAAATMARDGDDRLASVTLMAAQVDFAEAGELLLFLDESQVAFLEDLMWDQGYLDRPQMSRTFAAIRAEDLIYTRAVRRYFLGKDDLPSDLTVWNDDTTRMPARMHGEYLRGLFLENRLTSGRFAVGGRVIALKDIEAPIFAIGTENDHIAPWKSVYKIRLFSDSELTFVLTSSGHNGGILSEPGHPRRHFRISKRERNDLYMGPDEWMAAKEPVEGSWWPEYVGWLKQHGSGEAKPPPMGRRAKGIRPLCDAPGTYIFQT